MAHRRMDRKSEDRVTGGTGGDGVDRRGFLECMAWAGAGLVWSMHGGIASSRLFASSSPSVAAGADLSFVQISDSHIGFDKPANTDVTATLQAAIDKINALPAAPEFILHTGDLSHLSKPSEFDTVDQILRSAKTQQVFFVPGEHDVVGDEGQQYLKRYGKGTKGAGWQSFDHKGVHFVGLVNVMNLKAGGLGNLGQQQLEWLEDDLRGRTASTPIVVFAHIPLWTVYPEWGWGTQDSAQALKHLQRFGSVTVLNGHIHQIMQKVEGKVTFHTAMATAFPQPVPGTAPSPGPLRVPSDRLRSVLGITDLRYVAGGHHLAVLDETLAGTAPNEASAILRGAAAALPAVATAGGTSAATGGSGRAEVAISNFAFTPAQLTIAAGTAVTWTNRDDTAHTATSNDGVFSSPLLDSNQTFQYTFAKSGQFAYYCKVHPMMKGVVVVR